MAAAGMAPRRPPIEPRNPPPQDRLVQPQLPGHRDDRHPKLSEDQKKVIALDYGMRNGNPRMVFEERTLLAMQSTVSSCAGSTCVYVQMRNRLVLVANDRKVPQRER